MADNRFPRDHLTARNAKRERWRAAFLVVIGALLWSAIVALVATVALTVLS